MVSRRKTAEFNTDLHPRSAHLHTGTAMSPRETAWLVDAGEFEFGSVLRRQRSQQQGGEGEESHGVATSSAPSLPDAEVPTRYIGRGSWTSQLIGFPWQIGANARNDRPEYIT